jgi:predicted ferric reductase
MNHEFTYDTNSTVLKAERFENRSSSSNRIITYAKKNAAPCVNEEKMKDSVLGRSKIVVGTSNLKEVLATKLRPLPKRDVADDDSIESNIPCCVRPGAVDDLATETHNSSFQNTTKTHSETFSAQSQRKRNYYSGSPSSGSFASEDLLVDPSSGSFYCDDTVSEVTGIPNCEQSLSKSRTGKYASPSNEDLAASLQRYEPTLEDLMSIMEYDEPNCIDDSPCDEEFNTIETTLSINPMHDKSITKVFRGSSSELFPTSSIEFTPASFSKENDWAQSKQHSSVGPGDSCHDDNKQVQGRKRKMSETLEIMDEKCSPNRPHPALEYPPLYFLLRRWPWLFEKIKIPYVYRWRLSYPLQKNVPYGTGIQKLGIRSTWGELLILIPFFVSIVVGLAYTMVFPSVSMTGKIARFALISTLVFAQRNSLVTLLIGMPFDRGLFYHKLSGRIVGIASILHAAAFFVDPVFKRKHAQDFFRGAFTGQVNFSGSVMLFIVIAIGITAMARIRRRVYEVFYYLHVVFALCIIAGAFFHSGILLPFIAVLTWGVDLCIRSIVMARTLYPRKATLKVVSDTVIQVSFPKTTSFAYNPGQYVYLSIPEISWLQWHPFSISSSPKQRIVTLHIRKVGNWTTALFDLSKKKQEVSILLEGPYGNLSVDLMNDRKYKNILLISGGIGSKYCFIVFYVGFYP